MAILLNADRVKETTQTTGTGTLTLDGAVAAFRTFLSGVGSGNTCHYTITDGTDWEVGVGTVGSGTLTRTTILASSNAGAAVNWGAGSKNVFLDQPAERLNPTLINRQVLSGAVSSVDVTGLTDDYDWYEWVFYNLTGSVDGDGLYLRVSIAAAFLAANYEGEIGDFASAAASSATLTGNQLTIAGNIGTAASEHCSGRIKLFNPGGTARYKHLMWDLEYETSGSTWHRNAGAGAYVGGTGAVDGMRLLASTGNLVTGSFDLYGFRSA